MLCDNNASPLTSLLSPWPRNVSNSTTSTGLNTALRPLITALPSKVRPLYEERCTRPILCTAAFRHFRRFATIRQRPHLSPCRGCNVYMRCRSPAFIITTNQSSASYTAVLLASRLPVRTTLHDTPTSPLYPNFSRMYVHCDVDSHHVLKSCHASRPANKKTRLGFETCIVTQSTARASCKNPVRNCAVACA